MTMMNKGGLSLGVEWWAQGQGSRAKELCNGSKPKVKVEVKASAGIWHNSTYRIEEGRKES